MHSRVSGLTRIPFVFSSLSSDAPVLSVHSGENSKVLAGPMLVRASSMLLVEEKERMAIAS